MATVTPEQTVLLLDFTATPDFIPQTLPAYTFEEHKTLKARLWNGEIQTISEIQVIYQRIKSSEATLKAELNQKTLKQLAPKQLCWKSSVPFPC
jgi:hypothetical protein